MKNSREGGRGAETLKNAALAGVEGKTGIISKKRGTI